MDGAETGAVAGSHVLIEGLDGIRTAELTELLVHVVSAATGVVADPDAEVLDLQGLLLLNLEEHVPRTAIRPYSACHLNGCKGQQRGYDTDDINAKDFTTGLLDLLQLTARPSMRCNSTQAV